MFSYKSVRTSISFNMIFHTKHFSSHFSRGTRRSSLSHGDRNRRDDPFPILKFRSGNGCQASWQASVRISEGPDNRGPDNRGSTVLVYVWSLQFLGKGSSNHWVHSLKSLGKGSFCQRLLQIIIRLNTLVDVIRVPRVCTSGE